VIPNLPLIETDLDGDGTPEAIFAVNLDGDVDWEGDGPRVADYWEQGGLFAVTQAAQGYHVALAQATANITLIAAAHLSDDRHSQIVWSVFDQGAHSCVLHVFVSGWNNGQLRELPGAISMPTPTRFEINDHDLIVAGGIIQSAGAGEMQREYTDRYRFEGGQLRQVDRQYDHSEFAYDRLIDGVEAESWGRTADALQAYREAAEPQRAAIKPASIPPDEMDAFAAAVHVFARFRLGALLLASDKEEACKIFSATEGRYAGLTRAAVDITDHVVACSAAAAWAATNPAFLKTLTGAFGYNNPEWEPQNVCGPLPPCKGCPHPHPSRNGPIPCRPLLGPQ
jgi:hypothetical protein